MSNRGAYSTKERMPSDRRQSHPLSAWKAVHDWLSDMTFRDVLPSRQNIWIMGLIPAHPRFTRMYGVTHSIAFQASLDFRLHIRRGYRKVSLRRGSWRGSIAQRKSPYAGRFRGSFIRSLFYLYIKTLISSLSIC